MPRRSADRLAVQTAALGAAVPVVVAHRLARLAAAGALPSARDRREFHRMGAEKAAAGFASWQAIGLEMLRLQQGLAFAWWRALFWPGAFAGRGVPALPRDTLLRLWSAALAPIHRTATANARRLGRGRR